MKQFRSYYLKEDIKDILLSDYKNKEMLLNEILDEYLFLINDETYLCISFLQFFIADE